MTRATGDVIYRLKDQRSRSQNCIMLRQEMCHNLRMKGHTNFKLIPKEHVIDILKRRSKFKVTSQLIAIYQCVLLVLITQERTDVRNFKGQYTVYMANATRLANGQQHELSVLISRNNDKL